MNAALVLNGITKTYRLGEHVSPLHRSLKRTLEMLTRGKSQRTTLYSALDDVSFTAEKGQVVGIIGRNGAGKSTLLRIIAGLTSPTDGTVEVHGRIGTLLGLGLGVHPELTGRENVTLSGTLLGMGKAHTLQSMEEIVAFSELEKFMDTPVKFYSAGMRSRLSFSIAVHLEHPDILLIDEVLASGDIAFRKKAFAKIEELARSGRTVLIASHSVGRIKEIADVCVHLQHGKVVDFGSATDVVDRYAKSVETTDKKSV